MPVTGKVICLDAAIVKYLSIPSLLFPPHRFWKPVRCYSTHMLFFNNDTPGNAVLNSSPPGA
jgi:hypothetical protein